MNDKVKQQIDTIEIPDELDERIKLGATLASNERTKKPNKRKITFVAGIAVVTCLLLVNTMMHSKTVVAYIAEIPMLSTIFNLDPLTEQIYAELEENDYDMDNIDGIHISLFSGNEVSITIGGTQNYQAAFNDKIKQTVELFLKKEGYSKFHVEVIEQTEPFVYNLTEEQKKEKEQMEQEIETILMRSQIDYEYLEVEPLEKNIYLQVSIATNEESLLKEHSTSLKKDLEREVDVGEYDLFVSASGPDVTVGDNYTLRPATELDKAITHLAVELTEKKDYHVTGFSYTEEPLTFTINTSVSSSDKEHGKYLEDVIHQYLESTDVAPSLHGTSYEVVIYSEDGKQMN